MISHIPTVCCQNQEIDVGTIQSTQVQIFGFQRFGGIFFVFFLIFIFLIYFLAVLGLRCCTRAFSSCCEQGPLFVAVRGLLIAVAPLVAEHGL